MKRLTFLWPATAGVCCVALFAITSSCSTPKAPRDFDALSNAQPCQASWNLSYERLVGDQCYRNRLARAARAGCEAAEKDATKDPANQSSSATACKVARMLERSGKASRTSPDVADLERAFAAGCSAGDGDGCALLGRRRLDDGEPPGEAFELFARGCTQGSATSCFELSALLKAGEAASLISHHDVSALSAQVTEQCQKGVTSACTLAKMLPAAKDGALSRAPRTPCDEGDAPCHEQACRQGDAGACTRFAAILEHQDAPGRDMGRAFGAYERACAMGDWVGCGELGRFYEQGLVVPRDFEIARALFRWGCAPTNPTACVAAGRMLAGGLGGSRDATAAEAMFQGACDSGEATGCRNAADLIATREPKLAEALFTKACELSDGPSCVRLARRLIDERVAQKPDGQAATDARIAKLYARACDAGDADGCEQGADRFARGDGVGEDETVAAELAAKACTTGSSSHCWRAADAYRFGYGVSIDHDRSKTLIEAAIEGYRADCESDRAESHACMNAAHALAHGYPKKKRLEQAQGLLKEACDGGAQGACGEMAVQQITGEIFPVDRERGVASMTKLCDAGDRFVCKRLAAELSLGAESETDLERALTLRSQGCYWSSDVNGCPAYAQHFLSGLGTPKDPNAAYQHASRACTEDEASGCAVAAQATLRRAPSEDAEEALPKTLEKLCVYESHDIACTPLGRIYESGFGEKRDTFRALSLYERVCDADAFSSPEACSRASLVRLAHKHGDHEKQASEERKQTLDKACSAGDAARCVALARAHEFGSFDAARFEPALRAYRQACKLGNPDACTVYIATAYEEGALWGEKFRAELAWACENGTALMCSKWGRIMGSHRWNLAVTLNQQACQKGYEDACRFLQINLEPRAAVAEDSKAPADDKPQVQKAH